MHVSIKKGSVITIPLLLGMAVISGTPNCVSASMQPNEVVLTAINAGSVVLVLKLASDLSVSLSVTVTP